MKTGRPKSERYKEGDIIESNSYGTFIVVSVDNALMIKVRSLRTGFEVIKQAAHLDSGAIKDPLYPSIYGVAFFGVGSYGSRKDNKAYQKWKNMLTRCYSGDYQKENPSYIGCTVCDEWLNFQNFAEWFYSNDNWNEERIELDKDIKIAGNKEYSPSACSLVTAQENVSYSLGDSARLLSPEGDVFEIFNISKFCREMKLSQAHISSVINGKRKHHKGWTRG